MNILQIQYHRNGVAGTPFHAVLFEDDGKRMVATVFPDEGSISVLAVEPLLTDDGVTFGINSWRGDHFEDELRAAINQRNGE